MTLTQNVHKRTLGNRERNAILVGRELSVHEVALLSGKTDHLGMPLTLQLMGYSIMNPFTTLEDYNDFVNGTLV